MWERVKCEQVLRSSCCVQWLSSVLHLHKLSDIPLAASATCAAHSCSPPKYTWLASRRRWEQIPPGPWMKMDFGAGLEDWGVSHAHSFTWSVIERGNSSPTVRHTNCSREAGNPIGTSAEPQENLLKQIGNASPRRRTSTTYFGRMALSLLRWR